MQFGSLNLKSNLFLSPLAGYTNLPFRLTLRELGGLDLATTDLVNARSLLEKNPKAFKLIETSPADRPLAVQLFGSIPEEMRDAAVYLESIGVSSVDINMGCPVKKVCKVGGGSAMMTELDKTAQLVKGMVDAVKIPITAKMRLGWDDENFTAPDLAKTLEGVGIAAIFVHGRTREQGFGGTVNLKGISKLTKNCATTWATRWFRSTPSKISGSTPHATAGPGNWRSGHSIFLKRTPSLNWISRTCRMLNVRRSDVSRTNREQPPSIPPTSRPKCPAVGRSMWNGHPRTSPGRI
jgi:hypothetical protein